MCSHIKALFFSVGNNGCEIGECGKGGKEWVRVGKSSIFFKCGKRREGVVRVSRN